MGNNVSAAVVPTRRGPRGFVVFGDETTDEQVGMDPQPDDDFVIEDERDNFDGWQYKAFLIRGQVDQGRLFGTVDPYLRGDDYHRIEYWANSDGENTVSGALPLIGTGPVNNIAFTGRPEKNRVPVLVEFNLKQPVWLYRDLGLLDYDQGNPVENNYDLEMGLREDVPLIAYRLLEMLATMHGTYVDDPDIGVYGAIRKHGRLAESVFLDRSDDTVHVNLYNWGESGSAAQDVFDISNLITALAPEFNLNEEPVGPNRVLNEEDPSAKPILEFSQIIAEVAQQANEMTGLAELVGEYPNKLNDGESVEELFQRQAPLRVEIENRRLEILNALDGVKGSMDLWRTFNQ